jgi:hypothetical protein
VGVGVGVGVVVGVDLGGWALSVGVDASAWLSVRACGVMTGDDGVACFDLLVACCMLHIFPMVIAWLLWLVLLFLSLL